MNHALPLFLFFLLLVLLALLGLLIFHLLRTSYRVDLQDESENLVFRGKKVKEEVEWLPLMKEDFEGAYQEALRLSERESVLHLTNPAQVLFLEMLYLEARIRRETEARKQTS